MDGPFWVTDGASGENSRERGFPGPPAVAQSSPPTTTQNASPLSPGQPLREQKTVLLSPLLEVSLSIQRSQ